MAQGSSAELLDADSNVFSIDGMVHIISKEGIFVTV